MNKLIATTLLSGLFLPGSALQTMAMADDAKPKKAPTCKQQARAKGLKDDKEIKAFIKQCKAAAKKETKKAE